MAHISSESYGPLINHTLHLDNYDVVQICDAASPTAAFASLFMAAFDLGLSGPLVQALVAATVWKLKRKNAEFGHNGVSITFKIPSGLLDMMVPTSSIVFAVTTLKIEPPA